MSCVFESIDMIEVVDQLDAYDTVAYDLMSTQLSNIIYMQSIITHVDGSDEFQYISAIKIKHQDSIAQEEISSLISIGLNIYASTLKATTHQYVCTAGFLTNMFFSDKPRLHYKQLS